MRRQKPGHGSGRHRAPSRTSGPRSSMSYRSCQRGKKQSQGHPGEEEED